MIQEIIDMHNNGWNVEDISDELGVNECYILEVLENEDLL